MSQLSHFDEQGASRMVDVGGKSPTERIATASGQVRLLPSTLATIRGVGLGKGNVFEVARLAGIMATKRTDELIPLCHSLPIDGVRIDFEFPADDCLRIVATVKTMARTGVEMEALTAVAITALTVYDMCKSVDRSMVIEQIQLEEKSGGASGTFVRQAGEPSARDPQTRETDGSK